MNHSDLLIIGDSFCSDRYGRSTWPKLVSTNLLNLSYESKIVAKGCGYAGASWWSTRKELLKHIKEHTPKVAIFCHTEPHRLPHNNDYALNIGTVDAKTIFRCDGAEFININNRRLLTAAALYYEQLQVHDYNLWAITQWFKELDELTANIEKVLHFYSLIGPYNDYTFNKGVTFGDSLKNYAVPNHLSAGNHFSIANNLKLAKIILNCINNYPGDGIRIADKLITT
jgi:hypothetical protein